MMKKVNILIIGGGSAGMAAAAAAYEQGERDILILNVQIAWAVFSANASTMDLGFTGTKKN